MLPKTLKDFNVFVDGDKFLGIIEEITLPKLSRKTEDYRGAGLLGVVKIDMGLEALECDFSLKEYNSNLLKQYAQYDNSGLGLRFLGYAERDDASNDHDTIEISVRGRFREFDFGTVKSGEPSTLKLTMDLTYYKYSANEVNLIEIDVLNSVEKVNGVDKQKNRNQALSI